MLLEGPVHVSSSFTGKTGLNPVELQRFGRSEDGGKAQTNSPSFSEAQVLPPALPKHQMKKGLT